MFLWCVTTMFAQFSGSGNGTENDPYLIFNENQLAQVSNFLNQEGVVFKLMKDLDLSNWIAENNPNQGWVPIGVASTPFKGKFYGNNHKISGLMINRSSTNYVGFFGYATNVTISDLTIEGSTITGKSNVGTLAGYITGSTVTKCNVSMSGSVGVTGTTKVGGLSGTSISTNYTTFSVAASVSGTSSVGGMIGVVESGTLSAGNASGTITSTGKYTGGLIGKATGQTLKNITVNSTVTGLAYTGGIAGQSNNGKFTNCSYKGDMAGTENVGGIVGVLETTSSTFASCHSKGKITASGDYAGGIVGASQGACISSMENCSHFGDIFGQSYVGGLIGAVVDGNLPTRAYYYIWNAKSGTSNRQIIDSNLESIVLGTETTVAINNCAAIGNIKGNNCVGGLIGSDVACSGYTPVEETKTCTKSGPKYLYKGSVYVTWTSSGTLTYKINKYIRNIVGLALTNNYYSGAIEGTDNIGGLVGQKSGGTIEKNYSYANIYGSSAIGGIIGYIKKVDALGLSATSFTPMTLKSNVAINSFISATTSNIGRIYGATDAYNTQIGALSSSEGNRALTQTKVVLQGVVQEKDDDLQNGTSIGPSALRLKANYVAWGWDFDSNWNIQETESYPYKKYQAAPPVIESGLVSQSTSLSGKSVDGGTIYLYYKDRDAVSTECSGNNWTFNTEALQSGAQVQIYAEAGSLIPSYLTTANVGYPGSGTEADPYRIYTAEDLQGATNRGYYKVMNNIDLTQWISENSPTTGWQAIGRNSGEATYINGDGHKVTGLWINTTEDYCGLFSNFSAGQIENLTVEVATGKKVKGGDYTGILIGRNANGKIVNCIVKGDVEGTTHTGGVAGSVENSTISSVSYEGNVSNNTASAFVGGLFGMSNNCEISECTAKPTITAKGANGKIGGLSGSSTSGAVTKSNAETTLKATGSNCYVGGLIGYSESPVSLCSSSGDVSASGENSYAGGLIGYTNSAVENCYSTAKTTGYQFTAGLVAYTFNKIDKCYASGDVYGVTYGGGLVGELDGANAKLTNSVACNNILSLSAQSSWGCRVIGGYKNGAADPDNSNYALSTMQVSLNNVPQTKTDDVLEGVAKTQEVLMQKATYQQLGWDFTNVWKIDEGTGYPYQVIEEPVEVEKFTLTYKVDGEVYKQYELAVGDAITAEAVPTKDGYTFSGWSEIPATMPANDVTVTGTFTKIPDETPEETPASDNALVINNIESNSGKQIVLPIDMNNTANIKACQLDLYLPEGVTVAMDEDEEYLIDFGGRTTAKKHSVACNEQADGALRIVCTSLKGSAFTGNEGTILNVTLNVAATMTDGDYDIEIKNIELSSGTAYNPADVKATLTVKTFTPGDTDGNGKVTVNDAVLAINHILGVENESFIAPAADLDGNGVITVNDVVIMINDYILGGNQQSSLDLSFMNNVTEDADYLYIEEQEDMSIGEEREIEVFMNTSRTDIQGLQCDIYLPDGMEFVPEEDGDDKYYADKGGRAAKSHSVATSLQADGSVRVVETSTSGSKFKNNDLAVFYFTVRATNDAKYGGKIKIANMELSYGGSTPINPDDKETAVAVKAGTVTLNQEGYATFSHASDVVVTGAEAYTAELSGSIVRCTQVEDNAVPAYTGVILKGEKNATVTLYTNSGTEAPAGNVLKATTTADGLADIETALVLSGKTFMNYTGTAFDADKAYIPYDGNSGNELYIVFGDGDATSIDGISAAEYAGQAVKTVEDGRLVIRTANGKYSTVGAKVK